MSWLGDFFGGHRERFKQVSSQTQPQQGLQNQSIQGIMQLLQPGGGLDFGAMEQKALGDFQSKTVPGIAEMFAGMGQGGQRSSGFQGALGAAGAGLQESLAAMRPQLNMQLLNALKGPAMQSAFDTYYTPEDFGFGGKIADAGLEAALTWATGGTNQLGKMFGGGQQSKYGQMFGQQQSQGMPGFGQNQLMELSKLMKQLQSGNNMGYNETYQG
jgi:hypothetical protein